MFLPQEIIRKKRDNKKLTKEEINWLVENITNNTISDAQISAFAMAVIFNKLSKEELINLTLAMRDSGEVMNWSYLNGPVVDKHSTGGVGDLTSLMLAPMLAALGVFVPMIAGRGLGHTGGTLDKLDSIPGYNTTPDIETFKRVVSNIGCAIIGQTTNLAPCDKRIYAVRDTTATTESLELITSSILSKKLAAGLQTLVMDIKTGNGAFLTNFDESVALAENIVNIGNGAGCNTMAIITDMNQPLASNAGNALEVIEVIKYLQGDFSNSRLHNVTLTLASAMLQAAKVASSEEEANKKLLNVLSNGKALEIFAKMISELGGPIDFVENYNNYLVKSKIIKPLYAPNEGIVSAIDTKMVGLAVVSLGGGRTKVTDNINYEVGLSNIASIGEEVNKDRPLAIIHAKDDNSFNIAANALLNAINIAPIGSKVDLPKTIYKQIKVT